MDLSTNYYLRVKYEIAQQDTTNKIKVATAGKAGDEVILSVNVKILSCHSFNVDPKL